MRADEALMRRIAAGEPDALAALFDDAHGLVRARALRILRDPADAEEVVLEVFVQVWRSAADYDATMGSPAAWLTMLTRSRALDKLRSRRRRIDREVSLPGPAEERAKGPSPEEQVRTGEERLRVQAALDRLREDERVPIELAYYHGYSQSELAERLGQPLGTIKTRMRTGLQRLRAHLAPA